jgi:hypothetical protein
MNTFEFKLQNWFHNFIEFIQISKNFRSSKLFELIHPKLLEKIKELFISGHIWPPHSGLGWQPMRETGDGELHWLRAAVVTVIQLAGDERRWGDRSGSTPAGWYTYFRGRRGGNLTGVRSSTTAKSGSGDSMSAGQGRGGWCQWHGI